MHTEETSRETHLTTSNIRSLFGCSLVLCFDPDLLNQPVFSRCRCLFPMIFFPHSGRPASSADAEARFQRLQCFQGFHHVPTSPSYRWWVAGHFQGEHVEVPSKACGFPRALKDSFPTEVPGLQSFWVEVKNMRMPEPGGQFGKFKLSCSHWRPLRDRSGSLMAWKNLLIPSV